MSRILTNLNVVILTGNNARDVIFDVQVENERTL